MAITEDHADVGELLERERELERIDLALGDACGGAGGVLLVEGPAGIGKTALAAAAARDARARGMRVVRGSGRQLEQEFPYGVARQLLVPVLRATSSDAGARLVEGAGAAMAALGVAPGPAARSEYATLHALYWLLANLADERPLLVLVDDAHWVDQATARFLAFLAARIVELPAMLLLCARSEEWEPEMLFAATASDPAARPLVPGPLSAEACSVLVRARFDGPVCEAFAAACHVATGGNPFLLRVLLEQLASEGTAPTADSAGSVLAMSPRAVTRVVVARIGTLPEAARPVAAALAVLGDNATVQELAALTGVSPGEVRTLAFALARVSILAPGPGLRFVHPIVRNAVYGDTAPAEREALHRGAARLLEEMGAAPERVAAQLLASDPSADPHTCAILRKAAAAAMGAGAVSSAVVYLRRALAERCPDSDRAGLLVELGEAERLIDGRAAIAHLREALELTADHRRYVQTAGLLAPLLVFAAHTREAVATATAALSRLRERDLDLRRRLQAAILLAGEHDPSLAAVRAQVMAELGEIEREHGVGARMVQAQLAYQEGERLLVPASELAARAERLLSDELLLREDNGGLAFIVSVQLLMAADSPLALGWLDRSLAVAKTAGDGFAVASALFFSCQAHLARGELADAILDGSDGLEAIVQWGIEAGRVWCASALAAAQVEAGDLDGAERTLARVAPRDGKVPDGVGQTEFLDTRAALLRARGDPRTALALGLEAARLAGEPRNPAWMAWRSRAALRLLALGEQPDRAAALAEEEVRLARRWGAPSALGAALCARGLVLGRQGEQSLREAVQVLDGSVAKLDHAQALVELGALQRRLGRRRESRAPLRLGLEVARQCGARPLAQRAYQELCATGASLPKLTPSGTYALTTSERRVAEMAASGMSNRQIAQTLFVTVKTVETHLHRSYQKLDVTSRRQLADALTRTP